MASPTVSQFTVQIAFDNLFTLGEGAGSWLQGVVLALSTADPPPRCLIVGAGDDDLPAVLRDLDSVEAVPKRAVRESDAARLLRGARRRVRRHSWEDPALTDIAASRDIDLWVSFGTWHGLGTHRPLLAAIADFQHRHLPQFFSPGEVERREWIWNDLADRAAGIITLSEAARGDALSTRPDVAERLFVAAFPPAFRAPDLALDPDEVRRRYGLPEAFFVVSNQFWMHKNHLAVFEAMRRRRARGEDVPTIAFTGRLDDYRDAGGVSRLLQAIHSGGIHAECRLLGVLPRREQVALIRAATAVVQPSLFEGRGAIIEEASVLGTPVLCSDIPVHHELRAPGAVFFVPGDADHLADLIGREYPHSPVSDDAVLAAVDDLLRAYGAELLDICKKVIGAASRRRD